MIKNIKSELNKEGGDNLIQYMLRLPFNYILRISYKLICFVCLSTEINRIIFKTPFEKDICLSSISNRKADLRRTRALQATLRIKYF